MPPKKEKNKRQVNKLVIYHSYTTRSSDRASFEDDLNCSIFSLSGPSRTAKNHRILSKGGFQFLAVPSPCPG